MEKVNPRVLNMKLLPGGHAKYIFTVGYAKKEDAIEGHVD